MPSRRCWAWGRVLALAASHFLEIEGMTQERRALYPEIEPYDTGMLPVSGLHTIYYEQSGNPDGKPVVFLHGGPGAGASPRCRRFFDPSAYRIILFDQRDRKSAV